MSRSLYSSNLLHVYLHMKERDQREKINDERQKAFNIREVNFSEGTYCEKQTTTYYYILSRSTSSDPSGAYGGKRLNTNT